MDDLSSGCKSRFGQQMHTLSVTSNPTSTTQRPVIKENTGYNGYIKLIVIIMLNGPFTGCLSQIRKIAIASTVILKRIRQPSMIAQPVQEKAQLLCST